jgi:NADH-quinone oxidoreductase subunit J
LVLVAALVIIPVSIIPFTRNAVHALLLMAISMMGVAALYLFLAAELLAVFQLIVYVGGILVVLAIGIMVSDRGKEGKPSARSYQLWLAVPLALVVAAAMWHIQMQIWQQVKPISTNAGSSSIFKPGKLLVTQHWLSFELAGLLLFCALIGVLYIVGNQVYGKKS